MMTLEMNDDVDLMQLDDDDDNDDGKGCVVL